MTMQGEWVHATSDSSLSYWNSGVNVQFPLTGQLDVKADWKDVLTSGSIKEAINKIHPKVYQLFGEVGMSHQDYMLPDHFGSFQTAKAGLTGVWMSVKKKRIKSFLLNTNVRITDRYDDLGRAGVNPSVFMGTARLFDLKTLVVFGGYATWFGNRFIPAPVIMLNHRWNNQWSYTLTFPVQAKLTYKFSKKFKQDMVVSFHSFNHATEFSGIEPGLITLQETDFRFSTQSRIKMGEGNYLYLEAGWQDFTQVDQFHFYHPSPSKRSFAGGLFAKFRLSVPLGKALLDSKWLEFEM